MALFTDGPAASIADLCRYDSSAEDLAHDAGINLDAKLSVAAEEVGQEIFSFLLFQSTSAGGGFSFNSAPGEATRRRIGLGDVVITQPVRRWTALKALSGLYRDAYASDVTDRFRLKWEEYEKLAEEAQDFTLTTGIGLARNPVPKAPVAVVTQPSQTTERTDCSVRVTWVNAGGIEGAPSDLWYDSLGAGDRITVTGPTPSGVAGWNVYIALGDGTPLQQNAAPLAADAAWTMIEGALEQGKAVIEGQTPDYIVVERRIL
jgi:hypothetical protein